MTSPPSGRKRAKSDPAARRPKAPRPAPTDETKQKTPPPAPPRRSEGKPRAETIPDVGINLHLLRQERGLTLAELSERSGVSKAMLNQIESGRSSPTIATGWKIANGLGVPFGALLGEPMPGDFVIHRRDQVQVFYSDNKVLCSRALFPPGDPRAAELFELSLEPGSEERAQAHTTGTREQIFVTAGQLTIECGESTASLQPGDVLFFCADRPHRYHNPGREPARFILVMLYPAVRRARAGANPEHV
jgi:transcriptional regulator with XRE-family HTH domain